jgi:hypothetical protein
MTLSDVSTGPSVERVVRTALLMLLIDGFAVAYLWDGYAGYPRKNAKELLQLLGLSGQPLPPINPAVTAVYAKQIVQDVRPGELTSVVTSRLGEPGLRHAADLYYVGPGGWLKVAANAGRITSVAWTDGGQTESDQKWQRWIGYALCVASILVTIQMVRVVSTRLTLTPNGLQVGRRQPIPLSAITAVAGAATARNGVEIHYIEAAAPNTLRLDPYLYKDLAPVVRAICEHRGFDSPIRSATAGERC